MAAHSVSGMISFSAEALRATPTVHCSSYLACSSPAGTACLASKSKSMAAWKLCPKQLNFCAYMSCTVKFTRNKKQHRTIVGLSESPCRQTNFWQCKITCCVSKRCILQHTQRNPAGLSLQPHVGLGIQSVTTTSQQTPPGAENAEAPGCTKGAD